jgi:hypothetical protein
MGPNHLHPLANSEKWLTEDLRKGVWKASSMSVTARLKRYGLRMRCPLSIDLNVEVWRCDGCRIVILAMPEKYNILTVPEASKQMRCMELQNG